MLSKNQIKMLIKQARGYNFVFNCTGQDCYAIFRDRLIFRIRNEIRKYNEDKTQKIAA